MGKLLRRLGTHLSWVVSGIIEALGLLQVVKWIEKLFQLGEHIEFLIHRLHDLGRIGAVTATILDPSPEIGLAIVVLALCLIWFHAKWKSDMSLVPWILIIGGPAVGLVWLILAHSQPQVKQPEGTTFEKPIGLAALSNAQLRERVAEFAIKMREFEGNAKANEPVFPPYEYGLSFEERARRQGAWDAAYQRHRAQVLTGYVNTFAIPAKDFEVEIIQRLNRLGKFAPYLKRTNQTTDMPEESLRIIIDSRMLAGVNPISDGALYLERLSRLLDE